MVHEMIGREFNKMCKGIVKAHKGGIYRHSGSVSLGAKWENWVERKRKERRGGK